MLNRKPFSLFLDIMPLVILLAIGSYFSSLFYMDYMDNKELSNALFALFTFLLIVLISIISLWNVLKNYGNEKRDNEALLKTLDSINTLIIYDDDESLKIRNMLKFVKTKEDIYDYIHSSFTLLHKKEQLSKDEAMSRSDFLSTLSHEIRTPLNGIIGFSKVLKDMGVSIEQEEFLSLMEHSSHNLIAIVDDILDLSKADVENMKIENLSFDIFDMIESIVAPFAYQADQKDIELGLFVDPELEHYFTGDATKISQVLTDLVGNAVKFTDKYGKINISVQTLKDSQDETEIKFEVYDDGATLSQEQIENIFDASSHSKSKKYGGRNLGLTISNKMLKLMGGKLEVESKENTGVIFFFIITIKKDTKKNKTFVACHDFSNVIIGLALPSRDINRQIDVNLELYMKHFNVEFKYFYNDELFGEKISLKLPDIMIFDHRYARLSAELEQCSSIKCKTILLSNGALRSRVDTHKHNFNDIILTPLSLHKCVRILSHTLDDLAPLEVRKTSIKNIEAFKGIHALVTDDIAINRKLIKIILEKLGLEVSLASDGLEAFEMYEKNNYDIIFMDIQMPVMDGIEATHKILEYEIENKKKHTPIIAVTANVALSDKAYCVAEGMDDYTTKPLNIGVIKAMIKKYCDRDENKNNTIECDENESC